MKKLSRFDIGMIIAFVVIALLGGAAWWYLSGQLAATQQDVGTASSDFQKYSSKEVYLPTLANQKILQENIALMQSQLDPLVRTELQAPGNELATVKEQSAVDWKRDLDSKVGQLNDEAKLNRVTVPPQFYYGFSRYLSRNPNNTQTVVLGKQLLGINEIATIFIKASVKQISSLRRTYEEDPAASSTSERSRGTQDPDVLPGNAMVAPGDVYTAYPFEIQFETDTDGLRKVLSALEKSPYVFVIREMMVQNSHPESPKLDDLQRMAEGPSPGVLDVTPGAVGASRSTKGPQYLFGNETLRIKMRLDMIEWNGVATDEAPPAAPANGLRHHNAPGANR